MELIWKILKPDEKLIASKESPPNIFGVSFLNSNSSLFNLYLVLKTDGNYILIVFMRMRIIYQNGPDLPWTNFEKTSFSETIAKEIKKKWGSTIPIKLLKQNKKIYLDFRFIFTQINFSYLSNHWTLTVEKIIKGDWKQSYIIPSKRTGNFDSNDFDLVQKAKGVYQRG